ncbi:hypothetical protein HAX54_040472, partial [Datura stramonium]|nr:hypothetical protein [Datura stramonium]
SIDPEQHVQPSELDSGIARNMEMEENVNPRNMELLVSVGKTQDIMSAETSEEQVQLTRELNYEIATNVVGDMEWPISDFPLSPSGFLGLLNDDGDFSLPNDNFGWSDGGDYDDFDLARILDEIP